MSSSFSLSFESEHVSISIPDETVPDQTEISHFTARPLSRQATLPLQGLPATLQAASQQALGQNYRASGEPSAFPAENDGLSPLTYSQAGIAERPENALEHNLRASLTSANPEESLPTYNESQRQMTEAQREMAAARRRE